MKFLKKAKYIKYKRAELEKYIKDKSSCVLKVHSREHLGISMAGLQNLRETISRILDNKIGRYDRDKNGIVLDIRNTKVLDVPSVIRHDSADLHLDIEADFFVFQPKIGAVVVGVVKHISQANIGVVIYRVFNVAVKFTDRTRKVKVNQEIKIRVLNFDLGNRMPEIEGELVGQTKIEENDVDSGISTEEMQHEVAIKQERDSDEGPSTRNGDDSGAVVKLNKRRSILVNQESHRKSSEQKHVSFAPVIIKSESISDKETTPEPVSKKKTKKRRLRSPSPPPTLDESELNGIDELADDLQSTQITQMIKTEPSTSSKSSKKRKRELDDSSDTQITKKKRKDQEITIKQESDDVISSQDERKKKKKKKNKFLDALSSLLDEPEETTSQKPKIKKERL